MLISIPHKPVLPRVYHRHGGLLAWYLMGDQRGTFVGDAGDVADLAGALPAGVRNTGCTWGNGLSGRCLDFDGSTGYVDLGAPAALELYTEMTISAWFRTSAASSGTPRFLIAKDFSTGSRGYGLGIRNGGIYFEANGSATQDAGSFNDGLWHQVGITATPSGVSTNFVIWADGAQLFSAAVTTPAANTAAHWYIGGRSYVGSLQPINGQMDDVRFFSRSNPGEIQQSYQSPYWRLRKSSLAMPPMAIITGQVYTKAASVSVVLTASASESVSLSRPATTSVVLTASALESAAFARSASASVILTAAASTASTFSKAAAASVVLTPTTSESAAFARSATASIVVTASPSTASAFARSATASVVLTPTAAESLARPVNATASVVLTASASESLEHPVAAAASVVLTASASTTATMSHAVTAAASVVLTASALESAAFIKTAPVSIVLTATAVVGLAPMVGGLAVVFLTASASAAMSHAVTASASVVLRAAALANGGGRTARVSSAARVVLRARARLRRPWISFSGQYLGRYQQGVKVFRWPPSQEVTIRNVLPEEDPARRKGILYLYGEAGEVTHAELSVYEVVPGGDPGGPVIATHALARPDGDQVLAQLGSGVLAAGQGPYLDEGI